jgi:hypothetical protein
MFIETNVSGSTPTVGFGVPMGSRWRLDPKKWTNARHNAWVASKPAASRQAADTFGRALRDYGIVANQSGPNDVLPLDSNQAARYKKAGVTPNLLDGIDWGCAVMLNPPTATYLAGNTGTREGQCTKFGYV